MRGQRVDRRRHHPTRSAPVGVEIYRHRKLALRDGASKGFIVQRQRTLEQYRLRAFPAFRPSSNLARVDSIPRIAKLTAYRELASVGLFFLVRLGLRFH